MPLISVHDLAAGLNDPGVRILDARFSLADADAGRAAYAHGHIAGAHHLDLNHDLSGPKNDPRLGRHPLPSEAHWQAVLERLGIGPDDRVVVYDAADGAMAAARAWFLFMLCGHANVSVLDGGLNAWIAPGMPLERAEAEAPPPSRYPVRYRSNLLVSAEELQRALRDNLQAVLLDARAPERFRGDVEPIDTKAGHIPGALNRPFSENLQDGRFKPAVALHAEFTALTGGRSDILLSCGSGVTACHNALAMSHAAMTGWRLFAPSWSGWIADPENPVATGDAG
ncbi:MAG: sulfurtransferase [Arenimonas sp.]|nr:sulfurtransferase [Arenimonas sp.]